MRYPVPALAALVLLAGCGSISESRLNPFNWFSQAEEAPQGLVPLAEEQADPRPLVARVVDLRLEPMPGGALIVARAATPRIGYWNAALVPVEAGPGVLAFHFRASPPPPSARGTGQPGELTAGAYRSDEELAGIREIRVIGAEESRAVRR